MQPIETNKTTLVGNRLKIIPAKFGQNPPAVSEKTFKLKC